MTSDAVRQKKLSNVSGELTTIREHSNDNAQ